MRAIPIADRETVTDNTISLLFLLFFIRCRSIEEEEEEEEEQEQEGTALH